METAPTNIRAGRRTDAISRLARRADTNQICGRFDIFTIPVGGGDPTQMTDGNGSNEYPSWSPDGRYLAFSSTRGYKSDLRALRYFHDSGRRRRSDADDRWKRLQRISELVAGRTLSRV